MKQPTDTQADFVNAPTTRVEEVSAPIVRGTRTGLEQPATVTYRPEVDGLRALSIVPVVLYHANVPWFHGGFLGVDVFFVISGYLITRLIYSDFNRSEFSIARFYERRIRRIIPALYAVILFVIVSSIITAHPGRIEEASWSAISSLFMVSNLFFWSQSGYFGSDAEFNPLLHTWSLSVEEQFYVLFPVSLLVLLRYGKRHAFSAALAAFLISLAIAEFASHRHPNASFYFAPARAWELLAGAMIALAPREKILKRLGSRVSSMLSVLCFTILVLSFAFFDESTTHPGLFTLLPVLGSCGLLVFATGDGLTGKGLSWRPLVFIGLISYSLYLWHQPILVFGRVFFGVEPGNSLTAFQIAVLCPICLTTAILSWRFIEQPFRDRTLFTRKQIFGLFALWTAALFVFAVGATAFRTVPLKLLYPDSFARYELISEAAPENQPRSSADCHIWSESISSKFVSEFGRCAAKHGNAVLVTGGSHGTDLYDLISRSSPDPFFAGVSRGYCRAHAILRGKRPHGCHYDDLLKFASMNAGRLRAIVYTQVPDRLFRVSISKATKEDLAVEAIDEVISYLKKLRAESGLPVVILGLLPPLKRGPSSFDFQTSIEEQVREAHDPHLVALTHHAERVFSKRATESNIPYISKMEAMELQLPRDLLVKGRPTYSDKRHLTVVGQKYFGRKLVRRLKREKWFSPQ